MTWILGSALVAFVVALGTALALVRSSRLHEGWSGDHDLKGPQKFHARAVPRVGGIAVLAGMLLALLFWTWRNPEHWRLCLALSAATLPAFAVGLLEDITKRVSPARRMLGLMVAALLAAWWLGASIHRTDLMGLDAVAATPVGAVALALFAVAGVTNSVNIIDGFNGLASMCVMLMLTGLVVVGLQVGDLWVASVALILGAATFGLFVLNYPLGLIFLGDGGAYLLGFLVAELGILLIGRNAQVSPLFPLVLCAYPVVETVFSMYRRKVLRGRPMDAPDGVHLHSLIYRRLIRWAVGTRDAAQLVRRNSLTAPYLWVVCSGSVVPAILWWDSTPMLLGVLVTYVLGYVLLYWRIVRFRSPRFLLRR